MTRPKTRPSKVHQPCPNPACGSSDACSVWDSGSWYCHSCEGSGKNYLTKDEKYDTLYTISIPKGNLRDSFTSLYNNHFTLPKGTPGKAMDNNTTVQFLDFRGISKNTYRFYGVGIRVVNDRPEQVVYPYLSGNKVRVIAKKEFFSEGDMAKPMLFGMDRFPKGCAKAITITEGEQDALASYEMQGSKFPNVSVRSSSQAVADCEANYDYLNSFERIYICFDNDEPGRKAAAKVARIFDPNKVFMVDLVLKDANEYLEKGLTNDFMKAWWGAKTYKPKNIINNHDEIKAILEKEDGKPIATFPFPSLENKALGIYSQQLILVKAQQKIGKTEWFRAIEHHLVKTTDYNLGVIHLEESEKRAVQGLLTYELQTPVHFPTCPYSPAQLYEKYVDMVKSDGRVNYYTHFAANDPDVIIDAIRYMVNVQKCKFVFLDHMTMLAVGAEDERKLLDDLALRFTALTRDLDFTLFLIVHVNDEGQARGSRYIEKMCDMCISLTRNKVAEDETERNTLKMVVEDHRMFGNTGPCQPLLFDRETFTLREMTLEDVDKAKSPF